MSKIPCGGFELGDSLVVNDGKLDLAPGAGGGLPSGGKPYQQLVTDGDGNPTWVSFNNVIYRDGHGDISVDQYIELDGHPVPLEDIMWYGPIIFADDVSRTMSPCISVFNSGSGYFILTFMIVDGSSPRTIKIKVVGDDLLNGEISIINNGES